MDGQDSFSTATNASAVSAVSAVSTLPSPPLPSPLTFRVFAIGGPYVSDDEIKDVVRSLVFKNIKDQSPRQSLEGLEGLEGSSANENESESESDDHSDHSDHSKANESKDEWPYYQKPWPGGYSNPRNFPLLVFDRIRHFHIEFKSATPDHFRAILQCLYQHFVGWENLNKPMMPNTQGSVLTHVAQHELNMIGPVLGLVVPAGFEPLNVEVLATRDKVPAVVIAAGSLSQLPYNYKLKFLRDALDRFYLLMDRTSDAGLQKKTLLWPDWPE